MIGRLLVANRGEIARRVMRTCRTLGIGTVAVYSDADSHAPHVAEADAAVRLPGSAPGETYQRCEAIVAAAAAAGAGAVHPGYGFLSENAGFARAVTGAGLVWVGPPPDAIEAMGSKITAKKLMAGAGVPVLDQLDPELITAGDLPVLLKASAGGGGRGMRLVRSLAELEAALAGARAEAASAFGDPAVFGEPYLEAWRHIEVQVLADGHGTIWALGERECSIQRRHQKIIEESPSPVVGKPMRRRLCEAAVAAARAIGYTGAGTVEFLAAPDGRFFFLEMNTRLQVEHPVTECVTGLDLVALQLAVAEGAALPGEPPEPAGHAIEARLYAEDPADGWRPQSGTVHRFAVPGVDTRFETGPGTVGLRLDGAGFVGLRLDSGIEDGCAVGVHYDAMLAKLIAWAPTRDQAARRLAAALAGARIHGLATNRDLLVRTLGHPAFLAGETDTSFLDRHGVEGLAEPLADEPAERLSALAAALADAAANRHAARVQRGLPAGWRNVASQPQRKSYRGRTGRIDVEYRLTRDGLASGFDVGLVELTAGRVVLDDGVRRVFDVSGYPGLVCVDSALGAVSLVPIDRFPEEDRRPAQGSLLAPMPGTVTAVHVEPGDPVRAGQPLVVLEAMKMQHAVAAPADGVVRSVNVSVGAQVEGGNVLAVVTGGEQRLGEEERSAVPGESGTA
ncbi:MAG TPA: biotin carboxylase N-terminal domain-containing protein [Pseudonocardiaceae bacterium]|nr:biotin carboxylase N-terminal domain-containing protein [Pseudonocardiaceae bacterium]